MRRPVIGRGGIHYPFHLLNHSPTICLRCRGRACALPRRAAVEDEHDLRALGRRMRGAPARAWRRAALCLAGRWRCWRGMLGAAICSPRIAGAPPAAAGTAVGTGQVRVALILPLSAARQCRHRRAVDENAAEMALAEFNSPNIQLLVKDDGGTPQGAQQAAQQALAEGAEIIVGPLFAQSGRARSARSRAPAACR